MYHTPLSLTHDHVESLVPVRGRAQHTGNLLRGGVDIVRPLEGQLGEGDLQGPGTDEMTAIMHV